MTGMATRAAIALLFVALATPVSAGQDSTAVGTAAPGDELTVTLVTMGYGEEIWQNFGHNAIWIHDDSGAGSDIAYNYGMFDFDEPGFLGRFLRGEMMYWMGGFDMQRMLDVYIEENRTVWAQELNLTAAQKLQLRAFLEHNALPENRYYRYDYFRDNCSTRVRDALDEVLGGVLRATLGAQVGRRTYRSEALRLTSADIPINAGIDLGLGPATDVPLSAWDESFIPMRFRDHLRGITVDGPDGRVPLVASERVLYQANRDGPPAEPPARFVEFLVAGLLGFIVFWGLSRFAPGSVAAGFTLAVLVAVWALVTGTLGVVLAALWALTDHTAAYRNANLLQTNPIALGLVVLGPLAILRGRGQRAALGLAVLLAGMSLFELVLGIVPGIRQDTSRMIALFLPIHAGVLLALLRSVRPRATSRGVRTERAWRAREARASGRHR